jgi:hypothetical protein
VNDDVTAETISDVEAVIVKVLADNIRMFENVTSPDEVDPVNEPIVPPEGVRVREIE